jgi:hypothetical protein
LFEPWMNEFHSEYLRPIAITIIHSNIINGEHEKEGTEVATIACAHQM